MVRLTENRSPADCRVGAGGEGAQHLPGEAVVVRVDRLRRRRPRTLTVSSPGRQEEQAEQVRARARPRGAPSRSPRRRRSGGPRCRRWGSPAARPGPAVVVRSTETYALSAGRRSSTSARRPSFSVAAIWPVPFVGERAGQTLVVSGLPGGVPEPDPMPRMRHRPGRGTGAVSISWCGVGRSGARLVPGFRRSCRSWSRCPCPCRRWCSTPSRRGPSPRRLRRTRRLRLGCRSGGREPGGHRGVRRLRSLRLTDWAGPGREPWGCRSRGHRGGGALGTGPAQQQDQRGESAEDRDHDAAREGDPAGPVGSPSPSPRPGERGAPWPCRGRSRPGRWPAARRAPSPARRPRSRGRRRSRHGCRRGRSAWSPTRRCRRRRCP